MLNIFSKYNVRPATGASMQRVPGEYVAELELDISALSTKDRQNLTRELKNLGLRTEIDEDTLRVSGQVEFSFSRGVDSQGRKALWLSARGPIVEILGQNLAYIYVSRGWQLSTGRVMRELVARTGGEIRLPDGAVIYVGESEDYQASLLSTDGCWVHPKFSAPSTDSQGQGTTIEVDEDPFK